MSDTAPSAAAAGAPSSAADTSATDAAATTSTAAISAGVAATSTPTAATTTSPPQATATGTTPGITAATTAPVSKPWSEAIFAEPGKLAPNYLELLPEALGKVLKDNMAAARAKQATTEGMVKVPPADAKPEEWAAYHKAIGVPEKPEEYGLKAPETMPDGVSYDEAQAAAFATTAKELGLTPTQAAKLQAWQIEYTGSQVAASHEASKAAMARESEIMKTRFGGQIDATVAEAKSLEHSHGVPVALKAALRNGAADPQSPGFWGADFLEFAAWTAKVTGEDRSAGGAGLSAAASALAEAKDIMGNKTHPLHAAFWKGDPAAKSKVDAAYALTGNRK